MKMRNIFKIFSIVFVLLLTLTLIACGESDKDIAASVDELILALPADVTLADEDLILDARAAYAELTEEQKALVEKLSVLEAAELKLDDLYKAADVVQKIQALPADLKFAHKQLVVNARTLYDTLTAAQKALVTNYSLLQEKEAALAVLEQEILDQEAADVVQALISALPIVSLLELSDEEDVVAAREAYDELTEVQKALVANYEKLTSLEAQIVLLKDLAQKALDQAAAAEVDLMISQLPALLLLEDKPLVVAAREAYDALTEVQKSYSVNLSLLVRREERIANLELAQPVVDLIANLPDELVASDEAAVLAARAAYDALPVVVKELVPNLGRLELKEEELLMILDPDLGALMQAMKVVPKQILDDYVLPTNDGAITWSYKGDPYEGYDLITGEVTDVPYAVKVATLVATVGEKQAEVEVNFGLLEEGQTPIFYALTKPAGGNVSEGHSTYETQLEDVGFGGVRIIVGDKVFFITKDAYIPLSGTEANEVIDRATLRPLGMAGEEDLNNLALKKGVPIIYGGAGALYHNTGDVAITFDPSDAYGRCNNPSLGFGKIIFKLNEDGTHTVQPSLAVHGDNDSRGSVGLMTITLEPGDMLWTPHSYEVDYSNNGNGTWLNQNHNGILLPTTIIRVDKYKLID